MWGRARHGALGLLLVGTFVLSTPMLGVAQDTSGSETAESHPTYIHKGTCDSPDPAPEETLTNVELRKDDDGNIPDPQGVLTGPQVMYSESDVDVKLDDLLTEGHAVAIHLSADQPQTIIACGDIGGSLIDDDLYIGLRPLNDSGYFGVAKLHKDGDKTEVDIFLVQPEPTPDPATPAA